MNGSLFAVDDYSFVLFVLELMPILFYETKISSKR